MKLKNKTKRIKSKFHRTNRIKSASDKRNTLKSIIVAIYITFLLLSTIAFLADQAIEQNMAESYEYHLVYPRNGRQSHYYVERVDTNQNGRIDLVYTTSSNSLVVETTNIKVLHIYCRSMYYDECQDVFGIDPTKNSNYFKWYFIEKNHLIVNINADHQIEELSFIDTPIPYRVIVNGLRWIEDIQYNYTDNYRTVLSNVPKGNTYVDIYFKTNDNTRPNANIIVDRTVVNMNTLINFDATSSYDLDGEIIAYIWDFGDGSYSGGVINAHSYSYPGTYGVILTVRDNDFMVDHAYLNITVIKGTNKPVINGLVPNQIKEEDAPSWELDLSKYGVDLDSSPTELRWYLTGENTNLFRVVGENSTDQKLIFSLVPNAYGNDLVTLWLTDKDGQNVSQPLWINISSVNDKPSIDKLPNLVVHYDVPYQFSISNYIDDIETPKDELLISAQDQFGDQFIQVFGQDLVFNYPKSLMDEIILATVVVSDGEDTSETIISVSVSDNWPPNLMKELPDVVLYEGCILYDVFDLDDYFSDVEDDELYYSYGESHVIIHIKSNNTVDIISKGEWTGSENVIFRARDSAGGIVEDNVKITVLPINDPPRIADVPDLKVHYDMDYYFDLAFYISDPDNELSELTLTTSDPEHIRISPENNLGMVLKYPKVLLGTTSRVKLTVSDGILDASKNVLVTVISGYPPELVDNIPDISFNEDETLIDVINLDEYIMDFDNDTLYYTTGNKMIEIVISQDHSVSFSAEKNWFGVEIVNFRATDPTQALVEDAVAVTVLPVNDAPVLAPLPNITLNETEIKELDLMNYISDVDTNLSNINVVVEDPNIMVSGKSIVIFGSEDLPDKILISISDGDKTTNGILNVKVISKSREADGLNLAVVIFVIILIMIIIIILIVSGYLRLRKQKYEIEEIFLIHNSGKLLSHLYNKIHSRFDDDIFSGMFSAIQLFIEDSFSRDDQSQCSDTIVNDQNKKTSITKPMKLNEFKVGDNQVIVEHGKYIFMAVVYTGPGNIALHRVIKHCIMQLETRYGDQLEYWDGDLNHFKGLKIYLKKLLPETKFGKNKINTIQSHSYSSLNAKVK